MRCHPGVSFPLERLVPEGGLDVCGVHLQPGTVVGMNAAVMHYDKSIFGDDAALFRPERWTESDAEHIKFMDRHLMTVSVLWCDSYLVADCSNYSLAMAPGHVSGRTYLLWRWES